MNSPVILFDGVCNLCNSAVQFIIKKDKNKVFKFASLQSEFGQRFLSENKLATQSFDTIILIDADQIFFKSKAVFKIIEKLPKFKWICLVANLPVSITDFIYSFVSRNRLKWFGKQEGCWLPTPDLKDRFIS